MAEQIDLTGIGIEYKITDKTGDTVKILQVLDHNDILDATLGHYSEKYHGNYEEYLNKSVSLVSNYAKYPYVLWLAIRETELDVSEVVKQAIQGNYGKVVIELIPDHDDVGYNY